MLFLYKLAGFDDCNNDNKNAPRRRNTFYPGLHDQQSVLTRFRNSLASAFNTRTITLLKVTPRSKIVVVKIT